MTKLKNKESGSEYLKKRELLREELKKKHCPVFSAFLSERINAMEDPEEFRYMVHLYLTKDIMDQLCFPEDQGAFEYAYLLAGDILFPNGNVPAARDKFIRLKTKKMQRLLRGASFFLRIISSAYENQVKGIA